MNNLTTGPVNRWRGLVFLCISLLVISLDNTVVNVALPSISNQLGGSDTDLQWIVAAYILVFAALLLTMGALGDRIGRKRVLQFGLLWFGAGSLLAALSPSTGMLILSRALLGVGGAMIMPSTLSIISATFLNQKKRFQSIAIWGAMFGVGSALAAGVRLLPMALVVTVASILSARLSGRLGLKVTVGGSILLAAVGLFFLSRVATADAPYTTIALALVIFTTGLGLAMPPATAAVMSSVPVNKAGIGSAMNDTTRQLGAALGVVCWGRL